MLQKIFFFHHGAGQTFVRGDNVIYSARVSHAETYRWSKVLMTIRVKGQRR